MSNSTTNTFQEGLMMDLNPLITPSNVLTSALNATLVTYNGNENVLQNDMGNGRVETAYLPEGYIPLGTTELGGIIYIVSYNPLIKKCQIGSFPSPERNITQDEMGVPESANLDFIGDFANPRDSISYTTEIKQPLKRLVLCDKEIHPGDSFRIYSNDLIPSETSGLKPDVNTKYLSAYGNTNKNPDENPRYLKLNVVSIQKDGTITNLNDSLVWDEDYYITQTELTEGTVPTVEGYRKLVGSGYTPYVCKTSGRIGLLAQLEAVTNFDCAWNAKKEGNNWNFYFFTNWEYDNEISKDSINIYGIRVKVTIDKNTPQTYYLLLDTESTNNNEIEPQTEEEKPAQSDSAICYLGGYPAYIKQEENKKTNNEEIEPQAETQPSVNYITTDIVKSPNCHYLSPDKCEEITEISDDYRQGVLRDTSNNYVFRKNDGNDNQYLMNSPIPVSFTASEVTFEVCPVMPYGTLTYLKKTFKIEINKLGTGEINLKEYRYFFQDEVQKGVDETSPAKITLNWGLEVYPEHNKEIKDVTFNFYEYSTIKNVLKKYANDINWDKPQETPSDDPSITENESTEDVVAQSDEQASEDIPNVSSLQQWLSEKNPSYHRKVEQSSYSGNFIEEFILDTGDNGYLQSLKLYLVEIDINYNDDERHIKYYRFMYTTDIFNGKYSDTVDFQTIKLGDVLLDKKNLTHSLKLNSEITAQSLGLLKKGESFNGTLDSFVQGSEQEVNYTATDTRDFSITPTIESKSRFKGVEIKLSGKINLTSTYSDNAKQEWLNLGNSVYTIQNIDKPYEKDHINNKSKIYNDCTLDSSISHNANFYIPFLIKYSEPYKMPVAYVLDKFNLEELSIKTDQYAKDAWVTLYYGNSSNGESLGSYQICSKDQKISVNTVFKKELLSYLKNCDGIHLYMYSEGKNDGGEGGQDWQDSKLDGKHHSDVLEMYVFPHVSMNNLCYCYIHFADSSFITQYKVRKQSSGEISGYRGSLYYYTPFIVTLTYKGEILSEKSLNINFTLSSTTITSISSIDNLEFSTVKSLDYLNTDKIDFALDIQKYIQELTTADYSMYTKLPSGTVSIISNQSCLYDSKGDELEIHRISNTNPNPTSSVSQTPSLSSLKRGVSWNIVDEQFIMQDLSFLKDDKNGGTRCYRNREKEEGNDSQEWRLLVYNLDNYDKPTKVF